MKTDAWLPDPVVQLAIVQDVTPVRAWRIHRNLSEHEVVERIANNGGPSLTMVQYLELEAKEYDDRTAEQNGFIAEALNVTPTHLDW